MWFNLLNKTVQLRDIISVTERSYVDDRLGSYIFTSFMHGKLLQIITIAETSNLDFSTSCYFWTSRENFTMIWEYVVGYWIDCSKWVFVLNLPISSSSKCS